MTGRRRSALGGASGNVRFGSKADMCNAQADVRFVPRGHQERHTSLFRGLYAKSLETERKMAGLAYLLGQGYDVPCPH